MIYYHYRTTMCRTLWPRIPQSCPFEGSNPGVDHGTGSLKFNGIVKQFSE